MGNKQITLMEQLLNLEGKVAVITGGAGIICAGLARNLASFGVKTAIIDLNSEASLQVAESIKKEFKIESIGLQADVTDKIALEDSKSIINNKLGTVDILINGAGGGSPAATTKIEKIQSSENEQFNDSFFGLQLEGFEKVFDLNFKGTLLPSMVFGADMVKKHSGVIVNISSMSAFRPLTKIPAYSAAKAAVNNFTQWLAVHFSKSGVRVNAIAPGFLLTNQNRFLMIDEKTNDLTPRAKKVINSTPMERFGTTDDLTGTFLYLVSDMSKFVTGIIIPVDGGFSSYSGV